MNRLDTLKAAAECVCGSREEDYGSPEDNFAVIAALWTATIWWKWTGIRTASHCGKPR